ncbi:MAG TPA: hypothetical protein VGM88_24745 [Kofleriaceae bacterium]
MHKWIVALALAAACGGGNGPRVKDPSDSIVQPMTVGDHLLALLPPGPQIVLEVDLTRLRANPVVGDIVTKALAARKTALPAGVPASPLGTAEAITLAAYGVGTAQAATVTLVASKVPVESATKVDENVWAIGPKDWVAQVAQRAAVGKVLAADDVRKLRDHAMPSGAPGASIRVTARLPFDARVAFARATGLDAAPAQLSLWADVVDDLAIVVDADATDPGAKAGKDAKDAGRRMQETLGAAMTAIAGVPAIRELGIASSLDNARFTISGTWVRAVIAIGPTHLQRIVERAQKLVGTMGE